MATGRHPYFSRIGWLPFLVCAGLGILVVRYLGVIWSLPFWLGCVFLVYLYRDPAREIPSSPLAVVSPADGIVTSVAEAHDPYLDRQAILVSLQMGYADVYSTRSPVEGKVLEPKHTVDSAQPPHGVWLKTDEDDDLIVVMHRGPLHNSPRCYVRIGDRVGQGQRCGYIQMGGKVDVYLPAGSRIEVTSGSRVKAGSDVIATLVHK
ncbi:MAG: phosphatidylserine decarboxylase [Gammaproteobacteria bacterium]|nr:MAG: phosphatidylserine decarboxylase [Gammaproteobacteria bacterium]